MYRLTIITVIMAAGLFGARSVEASESLKCDVGSVVKTFGETSWTVSSCNDGKSFVVVSAPGNPAMPFYFMITYVNGNRAMYGEGGGSKEASSAAADDLSDLVESDEAVASLIAETITDAAEANK